MIVVKRLTLVICGKERTLECLEKRVSAYICIGIVYKYARLYVACGIYVEIVSACRYAAADIFAVVLEVHNEHRLARFAVTHFTKPAVHIFPLVGSRDKLLVGTVTHGHIVEIKCEFRAVFYHLVDEIVARYVFVVFARVADRNAEEAFVLFKKFHSLERGIVSSLAAAPVV